MSFSKSSMAFLLAAFVFSFSNPSLAQDQNTVSVPGAPQLAAPGSTSPEGIPPNNAANNSAGLNLNPDSPSSIYEFPCRGCTESRPEDIAKYTWRPIVNSERKAITQPATIKIGWLPRNANPILGELNLNFEVQFDERIRIESADGVPYLVISRVAAPYSYPKYFYSDVDPAVDPQKFVFHTLQADFSELDQDKSLIRNAYHFIPKSVQMRFALDKSSSLVQLPLELIGPRGSHIVFSPELTSTSGAAKKLSKELKISVHYSAQPSITEDEFGRIEPYNKGVMDKKYVTYPTGMESKQDLVQEMIAPFMNSFTGNLDAYSSGDVDASQYGFTKGGIRTYMDVEQSKLYLVYDNKKIVAVFERESHEFNYDPKMAGFTDSVPEEMSSVINACEALRTGGKDGLPMIRIARFNSIYRPIEEKALKIRRLINDEGMQPGNVNVQQAWDDLYLQLSGELDQDIRLDTNPRLAYAPIVSSILNHVDHANQLAYHRDPRAIPGSNVMPTAARVLNVLVNNMTTTLGFTEDQAKMDPDAPVQNLSNAPIVFKASGEVSSTQLSMETRTQLARALYKVKSYTTTVNASKGSGVKTLDSVDNLLDVYCKELYPHSADLVQGGATPDQIKDMYRVMKTMAYARGAEKDMPPPPNFDATVSASAPLNADRRPTSPVTVTTSTTTLDVNGRPMSPAAAPMLPTMSTEPAPQVNIVPVGPAVKKP